MAERSQLMIEMILDDKQALRSLDSTVNKMERETKSATQSMSANFGTVLASITAAVAAAEGFRRFMAESIQQASEQEDAVNRLNVALKNQGTFTVALSQNYQAMADSIQRSTRFSDDAVLQAQQTLVTLGNVAPEAMARVTQSVANFSTATRTDLQTSAELFAKAAAGNTAALSRYGIVMDENIPKSQRFAELLRIVNERMGGAAIADINTYSGASKQMGNAWREFQEKIGQFVIDSPIVKNGIIGITTELQKMTDLMANNKENVANFVDNILTLTQTAASGQGLVGMGDQLRSLLDPIQTAANSAMAGFSGLGASVADQMVGNADNHTAALDRLKKTSDQAKKVITQSKEEDLKLTMLTEAQKTKLEFSNLQARLKASVEFASVTADITMGLAQLSGKASIKAVAIVVQGIATALQAVAAATNPFLAILKIGAIVINTAVALKQLSESEKALDEIRSQKFEAPSIPGLASGGTVTSGGSVLVGERGPEILRLPKAAQVIPLNRGGNSSNLVINIEMNNPVLSSSQIADDFAQSIAERVSAFIDNERARL